MSKRWKYHIISTSIIFLFGGLFAVTVFCSNCFEEGVFLSRGFIIRFCYNGISWMCFWKGSEFLVDFWNKYLPWVKEPLKRFLASVASIAVFVFVTIWVLDLFFDVLFFNKTLAEALEQPGAPFWNVFGITLLINVFMHGRAFLLSWRQASIDIERLKTEQVATQYNSLKNQVNPHFLFNSFNALSSLVYEDQDRAVEFIRKLSQVYRYVLDRKDEEVVPLEQEMDFTRNFVFLQQMRFGDNLKVNIEGVKSDKHVPPLAVQLLVENAIKHNVVSEKDPLNIQITIDGDTCSVKNSIKEKKSKDSTGIGLNNLIERYKYLTDKSVVVNCSDAYFEVKIPLLTLD